MIELLPAADVDKWRSYHYSIYMKSQREGWQAALVDFIAMLIGAPDSIPTRSQRAGFTEYGFLLQTRV